MFTILKKEHIAPQVDMIIVQAPYVARRARAGNFVVLRLHEKGERIPLTIAESDGREGTITLLFQKVGKTTEELGRLRPGQAIQDLAGPLGHATPIEDYGHCVLVGGGIGAATLYPILRALRKRDNRITVILGARTKELLVWEQKFSEKADRILVSTDDGSSGRKGFVTDVLSDVIAGETVNMVIAVGPLPMMKAVADLTRPQQIRTIVSLNPVMVEGTGMCGACRVRIAGETRFACIDGPEFDGHQVDFQELEKRLNFYRVEEEQALSKFLKRKRRKAGRTDARGS